MKVDRNDFYMHSLGPVQMCDNPKKFLSDGEVVTWHEERLSDFSNC